MAQFEGVYIPNITPFNEKGEIDEKGLRSLVNYFIQAGVHGLVPCGTTGESVTMTEDEILRVIAIVVEEAKGRIPVIAGTGSVDTAKTVKLTQKAVKLGVSGALVVCPYYNRPSQQGIIEHFKSVAGATDLPIIIYNIPPRTGVNMNIDTVARLAEIPNIVGIKESAGDINQLMDLIQIDNFSILSGEDHMLYPNLCLGGHGAILASGHIVPEQFVQIYNLVGDGKFEEARRLHYRLLPLVRALFYEPNPTAIKAALNMLGLPGGAVRLPMVKATGQCREVVRKALLDLNLIQ